MKIDRADMKLLTEAGFSSTVRALDVDVTPIFQALNEWMPQYAAGDVGIAMWDMLTGQLASAETRLREVLASGREGRDEARSVLAMVKSMQNEDAEAQRLRQELAGQGGAPELLTELVVNGVPETTQGNQGLASEARARPARTGQSFSAGVGSVE